MHVLRKLRGVLLYVLTVLIFGLLCMLVFPAGTGMATTHSLLGILYFCGLYYAYAGFSCFHSYTKSIGIKLLIGCGSLVAGVLIALLLAELLIFLFQFVFILFPFLETEEFMFEQNLLIMFTIIAIGAALKKQIIAKLQSADEKV